MLRSFLADARGNVLIVTVLMVLVLVAFAGSSIDLGRQQMVRLKMQQASDAAALAGSLLPSGATNADRSRVALRYFNLNFPQQYLGANRPEPTISVGSTIQVTASTSVKMNFISNIGVDTLLSSATSTVANTAPGSATSYDVIIAMDNSGSMAWADVGSGNSRDPGSLLSVAHSNGVAACTSYLLAFGGTYYQECATALNDAAPKNDDGKDHFGLIGATRINALRSAAHSLVDELLSAGTGNRVGLIGWSTDDDPSDLRVLNMTTDAPTAFNFIDGMAAFGATNGAQALTSAQTMANQFVTNHVHSLVLMTDGQNTTNGKLRLGPINPATKQYTVTDNHNPPCNGSDYCPSNTAAAAQLCEAIKQKNIQIYTVSLLGSYATDATEKQNIRTFLTQCASKAGDGTPNYFEVSNSAGLNQAFQSIYTQITNVRITQ